MIEKEKLVDIVLVHTSLGSGHLQAAYALQEAIHTIDDTLKTDVLDSLNFANITAGEFLRHTYFYTVKKLPWLWELIYRGFKPTDLFSLTLARTLARYSLVKRFSRYCLKHHPKAFIATHFFPPTALVRVREKLDMDFKIYVSITDYDAHPLWHTKGVDKYFVANELAKSKLEKKGVESDRILIVGVPIRPVFTKNCLKEKARRRLKLPPNKKIMIISGGGEGLGPIPAMIREIDLAIEDAIIIVICGYNTELREVLSYYKSRRNFIKILGFVDYIHLLYDASDLYVGKTGGLTSAEILAKAIPTIALEIIRGQERRNSEHLHKTGGLLLARNPRDVAEKTAFLINNPDKLKEMSAGMRRFSRPSSSLDIIKTVLSDVRKQE